MVDRLRIPIRNPQFDSPYLKTNILIQFHLSRLEFPRVDYVTDLKSCLDQIIRIIQALIDLCAHKGLLSPALLSIHFLQMIIQARWITEPDIFTIPHLNDCSTSMRLCQLLEMKQDELMRIFPTSNQIEEIYEYLSKLPQIDFSFKLRGFWTHKEEIRSLPTDVHADQEYTLKINLKRLNRIRRNDFRQLTTSPVSKPKDESWIVVLGNSDTGELLCIKRINQNIRAHLNVSLSFVTPSKLGRQRLTIYFLSDGYLGLDQQYDFFIDILPSSFEAQINTELDGIADELDRRLAQMK